MFGSILVKQFPPLFLADVRLLFTSLFLLGYAWITKKFVKIKRKEWGLLLLLLSLAPIVTAALASFFLKEKFTARMMNRLEPAIEDRRDRKSSHFS